MQVEALYNNGRLELPGNLQLAKQRFTVIVDLPSDAIASDQNSDDLNICQADAYPDGAKLLAEIRQILGPFYHARPIVSAALDRADYTDELEEKYRR